MSHAGRVRTAQMIACFVFAVVASGGGAAAALSPAQTPVAAGTVATAESPSQSADGDDNTPWG